MTLDYFMWKSLYDKVYNISKEVYNTNTFKDFIEGTIKTDMDALLDWRLRLTQLVYNPIYREDIENLNNEIKAVDAILRLLFCEYKQHPDE